MRVSMMKDKVVNLMARFPDTKEQQIEGLLLKHDGHAGQVAAALKDASTGYDVVAAPVAPLADTGEKQRGQLAKKDPASALLELMKVMDEHAQSNCRYGCIVCCKRLWEAEYFECSDAHVSQAQGDAQGFEAQLCCSVATSLNKELKMLVKLVKQFHTGKENNQPCENKFEKSAPGNISMDTLQSGQRVHVVGAMGRGQHGTLRNFHENHRRWSVVLDNGAAYYLRGADLEPTSDLPVA